MTSSATSGMQNIPRQVRATAASRIGISLAEYDALRANGLKWCMGCRTWLATSEFGSDRSRGDGLASRCANCRMSSSGSTPGQRERRVRAKVGERWCRGCRAWLPTNEILRDGACRAHINAEARAWFARNGEAVQARRGRAIAYRRGLAPIPAWWAAETRIAFGGKCAYGCGQDANTWDHIWPVSRGGISAPGNLAPACASCNSSKNNRNPAPWVERGTTSMPNPWTDLIALAIETNQDVWLEGITT